MSKKPIDTLRNGALKATIWKEPGQNLPVYNITMARTYTDNDGKFHDTNTFGAGQLLKLSHLATKAYERTLELREEDRS